MKRTGWILILIHVAGLTATEPVPVPVPETVTVSETVTDAAPDCSRPSTPLADCTS